MSTPSKPWFIKGLSKTGAQNAIGEVIYTRVHPIYPKHAGKITGMLLEAFSIVELDVLLGDEPAFREKVEEAERVLVEFEMGKN